MDTKGLVPPFDGIPLVDAYGILGNGLGVSWALLLGLGRRGAQGDVRAYGVEGDFGFLAPWCGRTSPQALCLLIVWERGGLEEMVLSSIPLVGLATKPTNALWPLLFGPFGVDQGLMGEAGHYQVVFYMGCNRVWGRPLWSRPRSEDAHLL
jgi:hypothetical protein